MRPLGPGRANPRPWQAREDVDPFRPPAKAGGRSSFLGKKISPRRGKGKICRRGAGSSVYGIRWCLGLPPREGQGAVQAISPYRPSSVCPDGQPPSPRGRLFYASPEVHFVLHRAYLNPPAGNSGRPPPGPGPGAGAACFPPWRLRCFPAEAFAESSHAPPRCPPDGPGPPGKTAGTGG